MAPQKSERSHRQSKGRFTYNLLANSSEVIQRLRPRDQECGRALVTYDGNKRRRIESNTPDPKSTTPPPPEGRDDRTSTLSPSTAGLLFRPTKKEDSLELPTSISFNDVEIKSIQTKLRRHLLKANKNSEKKLEDLSTRLREVNMCLKFFSISSEQILGTHEDIFINLFFSNDDYDYDNCLSTARQLANPNGIQSNATSPVSFIASRLRTFQNLESKFLKRQLNASYLMMAVYEVMHEDVMLAHRSETDTDDTKGLKSKIIRDQHFNTFKELVRQWKPEVTKPEEYASLLKSSIRRFFDVLTEIFQHNKLEETKKALLWSYLIHCMTESNFEITCFKKIRAKGPRTDLKSNELRDVLVGRLQQKEHQLCKTAEVWAGIYEGRIDDASCINPFWTPDQKPNVFSLPHLAAQELLSQYPDLTLDLVEKACGFPEGVLTSFANANRSGEIDWEPETGMQEVVAGHTAGQGGSDVSGGAGVFSGFFQRIFGS